MQPAAGQAGKKMPSDRGRVYSDDSVVHLASRFKGGGPPATCSAPTTDEQPILGVHEITWDPFAKQSPLQSYQA